MAYSGRMSMARSSQQSSQGRKKEDDSDAFMTLPDREIAGCISDIGIPFSVQDLQKPNPQQIQKVFEWFAELLLNVTREVVAPAMSAAAFAIHGDDADRIFTADTRELMGFFVMLRRLLAECGVKDFTFSDLYKPTHGRLVRVFSYIINFIRFRESQTGVIDRHFNSLDETKRRIESLWGENEERRERVEEMERNKGRLEEAMREKEKRSQELKTRLLELKKGQERVAEKLERARAEQGRLKIVLEERNTERMGVRREVEKLRPYASQSPGQLEGQLRELGEQLGRERGEIERLERRDRALKTSQDTFALVLGDVGSLTRLAGDVAEELRKEEEEVGRANRARDALSERSNNVRDVERQERFLGKQLQSWNERTDKLRRNADEKQEIARQRMEELRVVHEELGRERRTRGEEIERRRVRIETVEKKMADLKDNIENEVQSAREEYMKMESHIKLYITEMEQSLV
ncbi:Nuf2-like protein [Elsinoe fawcettii]|nr:Nuf2-like protein [Elsinoe fawcettii]